ncbi:MAG: type VII secretion integral membrane protein EccD [Mycobacterium sp.]
MTVVDLCRLTVRTHRLGLTAAVDVALPARLELGEMLPDIVVLVGAQPESAGKDRAERWRLSRLDGSSLDESMTLHENSIRDGDVLLLTTEAPVPERSFNDVSGYVVDASAAADRDSGWLRRIGALSCLWSAGFGATTLAWPGQTTPGSRAVIAAIVAVVATVAAILSSRIDAQPLPTLTLGMTAAAFGGVAGFLMVPGGPAPPNFFLAAAICSAVSTVLLHATARGTTFFTTITTFSSVVALAAAIVAVWPAPTRTVGAVLTAASLAMLSAAAKLSILLTGLSPRLPNAAEASSEDEIVPAAVGAFRAKRAHDTLTGLLAGFSLSAASGAVLVAADQPGQIAWKCVAFTGVVSVALILRASQQRGAVRSTMILIAGLVSTTAAFTLTAISATQHAAGICLVAVVLGAGALFLTGTDVGSRLSPFARRGIEVVDYAAIAAVVPLACWVGGVFDFVRGVSLT